MLPTAIPPIAPEVMPLPELCGTGGAVGSLESVTDVVELGANVVVDGWLVLLLEVSVLLLMVEPEEVETSPLETPINCRANRGF